MYRLKTKVQKQTSRGSAAVKFTISLFMVALAAFAIINRQWVYDEAIFLTYKPSASVTSLESRISLTGYGEFLFGASQPKVESASAFNTDCNKTETTTAIVGCYINNRIYVYNVTEEKLDGIKEVTAAHEMLHAAYSRLSAGDKRRVNELLEAEYQKIKDDEDVKEVVAYYNKAEPGQLDNELHSIIGTEVASVSSELESYYAKYFTNRQAVVALYQNYISVFKNLKTQADALSAQISEMKTNIETASAQYNSDVAALKSDIENFNTRADSGLFTSMAAFYAERNTLTSRIATLKETQTTINGNITTYNSLIDQYNSIASESQKLQSSLNSSLSSTPSV